MDHVSLPSQPVGQMGSGKMFITDISEQLYIANMIEVYPSIDKV
jgi:hypothetical protein